VKGCIDIGQNSTLNINASQIDLSKNVTILSANCKNGDFQNINVDGLTNNSCAATSWENNNLILFISHVCGGNTVNDEKSKEDDNLYEIIFPIFGGVLLIGTIIGVVIGIKQRSARRAKEINMIKRKSSANLSARIEINL